MGGYVYTSAEEHRVRRVPRDIIRSRELLADLVWKDLRVRYRYALMGFLWAVLEPLALTLVLTFVFTYVFGGKVDVFRADEVPPAVVILSGLVFWQFFAAALTSATQSLVSSQNLVQKVRFTREVVPLAAVGYPLVNCGIGFLLLLAIQVGYFRVMPGWHALWVAPLFLVQLALTAGLALLLSAANVRFRDVSYIVGVVTVFGFYASPVFYRLSWVLESDFPSWARGVYLANPMAELLAAYRQALLENQPPDPWLWGWPVIAAALALMAGLVVFRRSAPTFSDFA